MAATMYPELARLLLILRNKMGLEIDKKRGSITDAISSIEWISIGDEKGVCRAVAASDSSFILVESRIAMLYALQGISQLYTIDSGKIATRDSDRFYDAGFIESTDRRVATRRSAFKKALTAYAYLNEVESIGRIASRGSIDLALLDGSLLSFLVARRDIAKSMTIESVYGSKDLNYVYSRKVQAIEELAQKTTLVFTAKSSSVSFYTRSNYTDFQLFEMARIYRIPPYFEAGYSKPLDIELSGDIKRFLGLEKCSLKGFIVTYARLQRNSQVFQLSIPYIDRKPDIDMVVKCVRVFSPAGYPLPLDVVHRLSKLSRRILKEFLIRVGFPVASGREFIEL